MKKEEISTLDRIHKAALEEFTDKGFQGASLRNIVKEAGVTTGAFYGYYDSKEALFDALVSEIANTMFDGFCGRQREFLEIPAQEQQAHMGEFDISYMEEMLDYTYEHREVVRLLLLSSAGTKYENYVHQMVEIEAKATNDFIGRMKDIGQEITAPDPYLLHIICSGMFSAFFELLIHDVPKDEIRTCVRQLCDFHLAGWKKIMGI